MKHTILEEYAAFFSDTPFCTMNGPPMKMKLTDDAVPCSHFQPRSIPFCWANPFATSFSQWVVEKVLARESYTWHHLLIIVEKDSSKLRTTVDLTGLNRFVNAQHTQLACPERSLQESSKGQSTSLCLIPDPVLADPAQQ